MKQPIPNAVTMTIRQLIDELQLEIDEGTDPNTLVYAQDVRNGPYSERFNITHVPVVDGDGPAILEIGGFEVTRYLR